jgi:maltooligosyltrehalose synthase
MRAPTATYRLQFNPGFRFRDAHALVPWQVASQKINYRRFFYVNGFISLHIEDPQVFNRIHHTNWDQPNEAYEEACLQFTARIMEPSPENAFWSDFTAFQKDISEYGIYNSLSQTLLKITSPGLPDFYQGAELWDFNLVDPDNRRPVDFTRRIRLLNEFTSHEPSWRELIETRHDGRLKLFTIRKALHVRAQNRDLFDEIGRAHV